MKKSHLGLGVIAVMSAKGTATLAATMLLPTWRARLFAIVVIIGIAIFSIIAHRRRKTPRQPEP
ncbi:MAG TPA: hypothetical protein VGD27_18370 [Longimicrobiales bacterium]